MNKQSFIQNYKPYNNPSSYANIKKYIYPNKVIDDTLIKDFFGKLLGGSYNEIKFFLDTNSLPLYNLKDEDSNSPLHIIIGLDENKLLENERVRICEYLILKGANCNAFNKQDITPLHLSVDYQYENIIKLLINTGVNVNTKNSIGQNALYYFIKPKIGFAPMFKPQKLIPDPDIKNRDISEILPILTKFLKKNEIYKVNTIKNTDIESNGFITPLVAIKNIIQHSYKFIQKYANTNFNNKYTNIDTYYKNIYMETIKKQLTETNLSKDDKKYKIKECIKEIKNEIIKDVTEFYKMEGTIKYNDRQLTKDDMILLETDEDNLSIFDENNNIGLKNSFKNLFLNVDNKYDKIITDLANNVDKLIADIELIEVSIVYISIVNLRFPNRQATNNLVHNTRFNLIDVVNYNNINGDINEQINIFEKYKLLLINNVDIFNIIPAQPAAQPVAQAAATAAAPEEAAASGTYKHYIYEKLNNHVNEILFNANQYYNMNNIIDTTFNTRNLLIFFKKVFDLKIIDRIKKLKNLIINYKNNIDKFSNKYNYYTIYNFIYILSFTINEYVYTLNYIKTNEEHFLKYELYKYENINYEIHINLPIIQQNEITRKGNNLKEIVKESFQNINKIDSLVNQAIQINTKINEIVKLLNFHQNMVLNYSLFNTNTSIIDTIIKKYNVMIDNNKYKIFGIFNKSLTKIPIIDFGILPNEIKIDVLSGNYLKMYNLKFIAPNLNIPDHIASETRFHVIYNINDFNNNISTIEYLLYQHEHEIRVTKFDDDEDKIDTINISYIYPYLSNNKNNHILITNTDEEISLFKMDYHSPFDLINGYKNILDNSLYSYANIITNLKRVFIYNVLKKSDTRYKEIEPIIDSIFTSKGDDTLYKEIEPIIDSIFTFKGDNKKNVIRKLIAEGIDKIISANIENFYQNASIDILKKIGDTEKYGFKINVLPEFNYGIDFASLNEQNNEYIDFDDEIIMEHNIESYIKDHQYFYNDINETKLQKLTIYYNLEYTQNDNSILDKSKLLCMLNKINIIDHLKNININNQDINGNSSLFYAIDTKNLEIIKKLLSLNASIFLKNIQNKNVLEYAIDLEIKHNQILLNDFFNNYKKKMNDIFQTESSLKNNIPKNMEIINYLPIIIINNELYNSNKISINNIYNSLNINLNDSNNLFKCPSLLKLETNDKLVSSITNKIEELSKLDIYKNKSVYLSTLESRLNHPNYIDHEFSNDTMHIMDIHRTKKLNNNNLSNLINNYIKNYIKKQIINIENPHLFLTEKWNDELKLIISHLKETNKYKINNIKKNIEKIKKIFNDFRNFFNQRYTLSKKDPNNKVIQLIYNVVTFTTIITIQNNFILAIKKLLLTYKKQFTLDNDNVDHTHVINMLLHLDYNTSSRIIDDVINPAVKESSINFEQIEYNDYKMRDDTTYGVGILGNCFYSNANTLANEYVKSVMGINEKENYEYNTFEKLAMPIKEILINNLIMPLSDDSKIIKHYDDHILPYYKTLYQTFVNHQLIIVNNYIKFIHNQSIGTEIIYLLLERLLCANQSDINKFIKQQQNV